MQRFSTLFNTSTYFAPVTHLIQQHANGRLPASVVERDAGRLEVWATLCKHRLRPPFLSLYTGDEERPRGENERKEKVKVTPALIHGREELELLSVGVGGGGGERGEGKQRGGQEKDDSCTERWQKEKKAGLQL